jgi:hypothetical protein
MNVLPLDSKIVSALPDGIPSLCAQELKGCVEELNNSFLLIINVEKSCSISLHSTTKQTRQLKAPSSPVLKKGKQQNILKG